MRAPELQEVPEVEANGEVKPAPPPILWDDLFSLSREELPTPEPIVEGLIRRGEKAVLGGASKSYKSWLALDIALCVSHGVPWLGRAVSAGPVVVVNLELPRWAVRKRLLDIAAARGIKVEPDRLHVWTARGSRLSAEVLRKELAVRAPERAALVVVDPSYKLLAERDENSARDIADLLGNFEGITADTGAAVLIPTHFAKGNAAVKEAQDRISGSGVFARDPDSILTLTRHEEDGAFTVEAVLRTFPPVDPFVVRWAHPTFSLESSLDPARLKKPKRGPGSEYDISHVLGPLRRDALTATEWLERVMRENGGSDSTFYRLKREALKAGRVVIVSGSAGKDARFRIP